MAWDEIFENDDCYISWFGSPVCPNKVYCNVVVGRDGWQPLWNPDTPEAAIKVENARFRETPPK